MRTARSSTASWRRRAASAAVAAAALGLAAAPSPALAAFACEPVGGAALARQADLVFTGTVERRFSSGLEPAAWTRPLLAQWPPWLPVPEQPDSSRPGTQAVTMRAATLYKGELQGPEVTVRLLGRAHVGSGPWTVFVNRTDPAHLFTTECSGNAAGAIDPALYGLPPGRLVVATPWWIAAAAPAAVLLAVALGAAGVAGAHRLLRRRQGG